MLYLDICFFRGCNESTIFVKWKKRFKTVLIPYLFWNAIFYLVYFIIGIIPVLSSRINFNVPSVTLYSLIFKNYANPPLWFLFKLFLLQLISPLFFFLFKRTKVIGALLLGTLVVLDMIFKFGYSSLIHWIPVYFGVGYIALNYSDSVEDTWSHFMHEKQGMSIVLTIVVFCVLSVCGRVQWIMAPIFWFLLLGIKKDVMVRNFMKDSFFVFCTHYFLILTVRKIFVLLLGTSPIMMFVTYLLTFVIVFYSLLGIGELFKRIIPKIYYLVCRGR